RALALTGARRVAIERLRRAADELAACGAGRARDEAAHELRALGERDVGGKRRRPPAGGGIDAPSRREREIAALRALGHTHRQIAGQLFLSEKTVERHLSHIFVKLELSSRVQVAGVVARAER